MPFVGQAKGKGVYGRYHSVYSNFATLNRVTEDNATGTLAWVDYIPVIAVYNNV